MRQQNKVTGVVLAGGLARRMQQQDKGLVLYRRRSMVEYALAAMSAVADHVLINANRNLERYQSFGYPVISDHNDQFDGPLAGVLAAITTASTEILLVMPCDSPLVQPMHLQKLLDALADNEAEVAVAFDGERLHPVFLALKTDLKESLERYLASGQRKIDRWLLQHQWVRVDFSREPDVFFNINTLDELQQLQDERHE